MKGLKKQFLDIFFSGGDGKLDTLVADAVEAVKAAYILYGRDYVKPHYAEGYPKENPKPKLRSNL